LNIFGGLFYIGFGVVSKTFWCVFASTEKKLSLSRRFSFVVDALEEFPSNPVNAVIFRKEGLNEENMK